MYNLNIYIYISINNDYMESKSKSNLNEKVIGELQTKSKSLSNMLPKIYQKEIQTSICELFKNIGILISKNNKNSEKEKQIETNIINLVRADFIKDYKKEVEFIKNNNNKSKDNSDISQPIENIRILLDNYKGIVNLLSVVFNKDMEIKRFSRSSN